MEEGFKTIVACGGDGSVKAVISAIYGTDVKLGIILSGTANLIAANLDIPSDIPDSIKIINQGITREIDIGKINNNYMAIMVGCGLSAKIMKETTTKKRKNSNFLPIIWWGLKKD